MLKYIYRTVYFSTQIKFVSTKNSSKSHTVEKTRDPAAALKEVLRKAKRVEAPGRKMKIY